MRYPAVAASSFAARRRIELARQWLSARFRNEEILIVGGTLDSANGVARDVHRQVGSTFGWHRLTLAQLVAAVARPELARRSLAAISRLATEALLARVVHDLRDARALGRYEPIADTPGFARAVAATVLELRLSLTVTEQLRSLSPDLTSIAEAYDATLRNAGLVDWPAIVGIATETASTALPRLFGLPSLLLDVAITSEAELQFVEQLAFKAPDLLALVPRADVATMSVWRARLGTVTDLDAQAQQQPTSLTANNLFRLQQGLFEGRLDQTRETPADGSVDIFSAPGEGRESVEIARRVTAAARSGIPLDRIAVLVRALPQYRGALEEAFGRAGIPIHLARGSSRPDPSGRAFRALLRCALEKVSASRFAEYLSLGQVPDSATEEHVGDTWVSHVDLSVRSLDAESPPKPELPNGSTVRPPWRWERFLTDGAVIGGADRWRRRLDGLARGFRVEIEELAGDDEARTAGLEQALADLQDFSAFALPLVDELSSLPTSATWIVWLESLTALAPRALTDPERVLSVLAELVPLGPIGPVTLDEVLLVLDELLAEVPVAPSPDRHGKVFVGSIGSALGSSFHTVFVPGLGEKVFPGRIQEDPILLDDVRRQLGENLATNRTRIDSERLALTIAAGAAERTICFSYSRIDLDGEQPRARVPSFYALETMRAAEGRLPDFAELARRAELSTSVRLGWPAPLLPQDAIDDGEYDLAVIQTLSGAESEKGIGRYLVEANVHLGRSLRARHQRWSNRWSVADGLVSASAPARAMMAGHGLGARSYSPTALQHYAKCPYRFFLQTVHRLSPRVVPEAIDEIDALQRGSLIHEVQFNVLTRLQQQGLLPLRAATLDRGLGILDAELARVATVSKDTLAPAIERIWDDGVALVRTDLRQWLRLQSLDQSGFVPWRFELSFGLANRTDREFSDDRSVTDAVELDCGIRLRGSIDVIERHATGSLRVVDHKTGRVDGKPDQVTAGATSLQPLLYSLAAEKLFAGEGAVESGQLYFCTSRGGYERIEVPLEDWSRGAARTIAETVGAALTAVFLPAAPAKGECDRCDYRMVCGPYEQIRTARKRQDRLAPLNALRSLP